MPHTLTEVLRKGALYYHRFPKPGKLAVTATKPLANQQDLALAYSPGVAAVCEAIVDDESQVDKLTARGNLVAVITNGSAVLGLGDIGPLAAKPVMEGKAVLFKKFAGINVFDLEVDEKNVERFCDIVAALEPTFSGVNLEDIKAPECFEIEARLRERMKIPVFHDDQHGTAIIVAAAVTNGLKLAKKSLNQVKIAVSGAGAAAIACLDLLVSLGVRRENIWVSDINGVVYKGRLEGMNRWMAVYAQDTTLRTLNDIIQDADIFLGLSAGGVLTPAMVKRMADRPLIMALANPHPEITPEAARKARPDAMICTGRSDYPNQVNNVLCFPYMFRGALDVGATTINEDMKRAAVTAVAGLVHEASSEVAARAHGRRSALFGPDYLIPAPFDQRLLLRIAPAVARAAMDSGVARRRIRDFEAYHEQLNRYIFRSGMLMRPVFIRARRHPKRVVYAEGEDERALRAAEAALTGGFARPMLIGRPDIIKRRIRQLGLGFSTDALEIINPQSDPRYRKYVAALHECAGRRGIPIGAARTLVRTNATVIAALAVRIGDADAMICGLEGRFYNHLSHIENIIGLTSDTANFATLSVAILERGVYFFADTYGNVERDPAQIAALTRQVASHVRRFGLTPKIALLANSSFGSADTASARKMRQASALLHAQNVDFEVDGEMHANVALDEALRRRLLPECRLKGEANVFITADSDSANLAHQFVMTLGNGTPAGPLLVGAARPAHVLVPAATTRTMINVTAIAAVEALESEA